MTVPYRCVCGESLLLDEGVGGVCPSCTRRYDPAILRAAMGETAIVSPQVKSDETLDYDAAAQSGDLRPGQMLGHYRIVSKLGQGGMGAVYRALDESLQRYVAVKVIRAAGRTSMDTRHVQRLMQEAIAQARVNHPNVVHIYYVGRESLLPFFAMELVSGSTLADRLATGLLPFSAVVGIALQVADALRHATNYDIAHGDIKPSNILFTASGEIKLSDFGLARRLSEAGRDSGFAGTPDYLAPETIRGEPTGIQSDMYSLGITLFQMTFGRLPFSFSSETMAERLNAHLERPIEFPDPWPDEIPARWREFLLRLLAKAPTDRYQTYQQLITDLRQMQPTELTRAGRLPRALAWLVDLAIVNAPQAILFGPLTHADATPWLSGRPIAYLTYAISSGIVPLLACYFVVRWGNSPGKRLFQLRVVDRHGVVPGKRIVFARTATTLLPIWTATAWHTVRALGMTRLAGLLVLCALLAVAADALLAMFHRTGSSLHDLLFHTRVVLDATPTVSQPQRTPPTSDNDEAGTSRIPTP